MSKYEEIASIIRTRISDGTYPIDSMLPIQSDLAKEFGVSRMTIKKAIEMLTIEGLVLSKQGNGTKVLNSSFWDKEDSKFRLNNYNGLSYDMKDDPRKLTSKIIEFTVEFPDAKIAERLQVDSATPVLDDDILLTSVYDYLWHQLGLKFAGSYRHITAEKPDHYDKDYLACKDDDPILQVEQVVYLENGRPIEYSRSRNRFDTRGYSLLDVKNI